MNKMYFSVVGSMGFVLSIGSKRLSYNKVVIVFILDYLLIYHFGIILKAVHGFLVYNIFLKKVDFWFCFQKFVGDHISKIFVQLVKYKCKIISGEYNPVILIIFCFKIQEMFNTHSHTMILAWISPIPPWLLVRSIVFLATGFFRRNCQICLKICVSNCCFIGFRMGKKLLKKVTLVRVTVFKSIAFPLKKRRFRDS